MRAVWLFAPYAAVSLSITGDGTKLTHVGLARVDETPQELRRHAEHCRHLAKSLVDERMRSILKTMASEFDQQARDLTR